MIPEGKMDFCSCSDPEDSDEMRMEKTKQKSVITTALERTDRGKKSPSD